MWNGKKVIGRGVLNFLGLNFLGLNFLGLNFLSFKFYIKILEKFENSEKLYANFF
jgi:hypothetical protein